MLLIVGTIRLPADGLAAALPAMRAMVQVSRAEPGCIEYADAQDVLDAGLIHVHELWRSQDDLAAQWQLERTFEPAMPRERAAELMEAWERAVRQATQH